MDGNVAPDKSLGPAVLTKLKQFSAMNKLKKMALRVVAKSLSEEEIGGLPQLFKMIDTDNSGTITFEELKHGLKRVGSELMETEIRTLVDAVCIKQLYNKLWILPYPLIIPFSGYFYTPPQGIYKSLENWPIEDRAPPVKRQHASLVSTLRELEEATCNFTDDNLLRKGGSNQENGTTPFQSRRGARISRRG